jgi:hypothetical protein
MSNRLILRSKAGYLALSWGFKGISPFLECDTPLPLYQRLRHFATPMYSRLNPDQNLIDYNKQTSHI